MSPICYRMCFFDTYRKQDRYQPTRASIRTWLYSITANKCRFYLRSRGRFFRFLDKLAVQPETVSDNPEKRYESKEEASVVHEIMQNMPFKQREVFALHELEGKNGKEISDLLDISEGTCWSRLYHARKLFNRLARRSLRLE